MTLPKTPDSAERGKMPRRWFRTLLSALILVSFLAWTAWYVIGHRDEFAAITRIPLLTLVTLYILFALMIAANGLFLREVVKAFDIDLKGVEWLAIVIASSFANYFLPARGGAGLRALYLLRLYGFPLTDFVATLGAMYLIHVVVNGLLALAGMIVIYLEGGHFDFVLGVFFAIAIACGCGAMGLRYQPRTPPDRFPMRQIARTLAGWQRLCQNRWLMAKLLGLTLFVALATVCQSKAAFAGCSQPLSWAGACVYAGSKNLALLVSLTPGSLGIVEAMSIYLGRVLDYSTAQALLVQGLIRGVAISSLLCAGPWAFLTLNSRRRERPQMRTP